MKWLCICEGEQESKTERDINKYVFLEIQEECEFYSHVL